MVDSSRTQLASKFLGYKTIYAYSFVYELSCTIIIVIDLVYFETLLNITSIFCCLSLRHTIISDQIDACMHVFAL